MGTLFIVPTPIGNLEDITLRALRVLREADLILAEDTRTSSVLLRHHGIHRPLMSHHKYNEHGTSKAVVEHIMEGDNVALISDAGTPGVSDPGFYLVREALQAGVHVECLPGPTALIPALVASGLPTDRFIFEGFLPQKKGRQSRMEALREENRTMVFYESPHRLLKLLELAADIMGEQRHVCVAREISKIHETYVRGTLHEAILHFKDTPPKGEIVVVIEGKPKKSKTNDE